MMSEAKKKTLYTSVSVLTCSVAMCFVDAVIQPQYLFKSLIKIVLFLAIPVIYFLLNRNDLGDMKRLFLPRRRDLLIALCLGAAVYLFILGGYFLLRNVIDFSGIVGKLTSDTGVTAENFIFVAVYISFINSFLEEFFFRGFAFIILRSASGRVYAYIFSALMFAAYHGGMTLGYFNIGIFLTTLGGLFAAGVMFNFLNEKSGNIYVSWLVHMFANFAINTVGAILFGII